MGKLGIEKQNSGPLRSNLLRLLPVTLLITLFSVAFGQTDRPISPRVPRPGNDPQAVQRQDQASTQQDDQTPTFRTDVRLVNVYATVLDQQNAPIGGLTK